MTRKRISLLSTGGTISTIPTDSGLQPDLTAHDLYGLVSSEGPEMVPRDVMRLSSRAIGPQEMFQLATAVEEEISSGTDGIVITHGTDTLEETAYALSLLIDTGVPVVLTGAMRSPRQPGSDAAANLRAATVAAATATLSNYGPVVVMHDEIHAATWVTKMHTSRLAAFGSPECGPIGCISEGRVELIQGPPLTSHRLPEAAPPIKRVELLWAAAGTDSFTLDRIRDELDGLVVAGTGGGHVTPVLANSLEVLAAAGCPVIIASRCRAGPTLTNTYQGPGSESHLLASGMLPAGVLDPLKCRLRLQFGLSAGISAAQLFPSKQSW